MKRIPQAMYQTVAEIEVEIRQLEADAMLIPPKAEEHRLLMKEIAQLRIYADAKRWLAGPDRQTLQRQ